jgi:hypothetical protein
MKCPTGGYLKGKEEHEHIGGLSQRFSMYRHCKVDLYLRSFDGMVLEYF